MKNNHDNLQDALYSTKQKINRERENWSRPSSSEKERQKLNLELESLAYQQLRLEKEGKSIGQLPVPKDRDTETLEFKNKLLELKRKVIYHTAKLAGNENDVQESVIKVKDLELEDLQLEYDEWCDLMGHFLDGFPQSNFVDFFRSYILEAEAANPDQRRVSKEIINDLLFDTRRILPADLEYRFDHHLYRQGGDLVQPPIALHRIPAA